MPTILTPAEAQKLLSKLPPGAKIELSKTPAGDIVVTVDETKTKADILKERYAHLMGQEITVTDAADKYNIHRRTILHWKDKGYITVIEPGYGMTLNEAEVAYCVDTYRGQEANGRTRGVPLFDAAGLPYQLKHPDLSKSRRRKRQQN